VLPLVQLDLSEVVALPPALLEQRTLSSLKGLTHLHCCVSRIAAAPGQLAALLRQLPALQG
jgi:hypothetical protein